MHLWIIVKISFSTTNPRLQKWIEKSNIHIPTKQYYYCYIVLILQLMGEYKHIRAFLLIFTTNTRKQQKHTFDLASQACFLDSATSYDKILQ